MHSNDEGVRWKKFQTALFVRYLLPRAALARAPHLEHEARLRLVAFDELLTSPKTPLPTTPQFANRRSCAGSGLRRFASTGPSDSSKLFVRSDSALRFFRRSVGAVDAVDVDMSTRAGQCQSLLATRESA